MRKVRDLTQEERDQVEKLAETLTSEQIADMFGMCRKTFYNLMRRDDLLLTSYKKGKTKSIDKVVGHLMKRIEDNDTTATIFYLKTQAGWRETSHTKSLDMGKYVKEDEDLTQSKIKLASDRIICDAFSAEISTEDAQAYLDLLYKKANIDTHTYLAQDILDIKAGKYDPPHIKRKQ